jgi:hypothetical protein
MTTKPKKHIAKLKAATPKRKPQGKPPTPTKTDPSDALPYVIVPNPANLSFDPVPCVEEKSGIWQTIKRFFS